MAQSQDEKTQHKEAVRGAQQVLKDKKQRSAVIDSSKPAQQNDAKVGELAGSEANKEEMYSISADVLGNFEGKSPEELQKLMDEAAKNPEKFYDRLTPEQKAKVKELARKIEASKKSP